MKKLLLLLFFALFCLQSGVYSQNWYQQNARWYFNKQELLPFAAHGFKEYKVKKDTIVDNKTAKLIEVRCFSYDGTETVEAPAIIFEENSKVYYWNDERFKLMYDFSLDVGDTLDIETEYDNCFYSSAIVVDSIKTVNIEGEDLKVQYLSYTAFYESEYSEKVSYKITEKIGIESQFIFRHYCGLSDNFAYEGLRCYSDNNITYINKWWADHYTNIKCDSLIYDPTSEIIKEMKNEICVFPNPVKDILNINFIIKAKGIEIYNLFGEKIIQYPVHTNFVSIDLSKYSKGVYLIKINCGLNANKIYKIIKK